MPVVQILVGMIASGKSTFARQRAKEGAVVMSDDAIVDVVHAGQHHLYEKKLKPLYKSVETHLVTAALMMGRDVVIDRGTNNSVKGRRRWIGLATSLDCRVEAVVFPKRGVRVHATRRYTHDPRGHNLAFWLRCAKRHLKEWEEPYEDEGLDAITILERLAV